MSFAVVNEILKMKNALFIVVILLFTRNGNAQNPDSSLRSFHFSGAVQATNNGIALIPTFSLGKPAVMAILSIGGERFSFDPDIRFDMEGRPWAMVFWTRYKLVNGSKFKLQIGPHLGMNFRETHLSINGIESDNHIVRRYLANEIAPNYFVSKNTSVGVYYLYSRGLDPGAVKNSHFVTVNANFRKIPVTSGIYLQAFPQFYFLKQNDLHGTYFTATVGVVKQGFPLSIASTINKELSGDIAGSKDFVWNLSLVYGFNRRFRLER